MNVVRGQGAPEPAGPAPGPGGSSHAVSWGRLAIGLAALGYLVVGVRDLYTATTSWANRLSQVAVVLVAAVAYALVGRLPRLAASLVLGAVWAQLVLSLCISDGPPPGLLAFPVLCAGAGLLVGARGALGMGLASAVAIPVAYLGARWQAVAAAGLPGLEGTWLVVAVICTMVAALMTRTALLSYGEVLEASETARRRYSELFQQAPDGFVELDEQGTVAEANGAARRLLGIAPGGRLGEPFEAALRADGEGRGAGIPALVELPRAGGTARSLEISAGPAPGLPGGRLLVVRDVTERRLIEERLGHAQRLETVGTLAGGVAHDFNNLLTVIGGNAEVIAESASPDVRQAATEILESHARGVALTRQLLAFGRREVRQPALIDAGAVVGGIERLLRRLVGEHHRLAVEGGGPVPVIADRGQVEQVVINLVTNARDAMPAGGEVRVATRVVDLAEASRLGSELGEPRQALIEVSDDGVGMSPDTLAHVFQPFFTTKPRGKGTGLGLSTVHGIVAQSGGHVSVESAPGRGSRFRVFLPLAAARAPAPDLSCG